MGTGQISGTEIAQTPREISHSLPGDPGAHDSPDLMAYPFFALTQSRRLIPINYLTSDVAISVAGTAEQGIATIWDADILIWAVAQVAHARDQRTGTSRLLVDSPANILKFMGRGNSVGDHDELRSALDRLQSTTIATSIRQLEGRRRHRFSWISEWKERANSQGRSSRISLMLPDWLYLGIVDSSLSLAFDPVYFTLSGGLERWLYRVGCQCEPDGGQFAFLHLHGRSGSLMWPADFARHLRQIAAAQSLPGFELGVIRAAAGQEILSFVPRAPSTLPKSNRPANSLRSGEKS